MSHAKARRIAWGEQHKSPPRTSAMPPPSLDTLRDAYQRRNESCESMIRLGSMLEDIETAHGVGYKFEKFADLLVSYKTLMRYKKLSADFRDAIELYDPNPASLVFDGSDEPWLVPIRERARKLLDGCGRAFRELAARIARYGQQPGLRPEPRLGDAIEEVRGRRPPVDVSRSHGA